MESHSSPFRHPPFRRFYFGATAMALGFNSLMTIVAWLMATLTPSALMVSLVQTASTVPTLLLGLVAGAVADIAGRRRVIVSTQILLIATSVILGILTLTGLANEVLLLGLIFLAGLGFTFFVPAQFSDINNLVPHGNLPTAMALANTTFTGARAVAPVLAAVAMAWIGYGGAALLTALCFILMLVVLGREKRGEQSMPAMPERLFAGIGSGLRYIRHSPVMRAVIARNVSYSFCAFSLMALLPVIARDQLSMGVIGFGTLQAFFGVGAVLGSLLLPPLLLRISLNAILNGGTVCTALAMLLVASTNSRIIATCGVTAAALAWGCVLTAIATGAQSALPGWVRARAISVTMVAVQGTLAVASASWGWLALVTDVRTAIVASALLMLVFLVLSLRIRLTMTTEKEVRPSAGLPGLGLSSEPSPDAGPVLIQLTYQIDAGNHERFATLVHSLEPIRRRNGASDWLVLRDLEEPGRFVELFTLLTWGDYLRMRERLTVTERELLDQVGQLQHAGAQAQISRLIVIDRAELPSAWITR